MNSDLQNFQKGNINFQKVKFNKSKERFKKLVEEGQNPKALFIGCSDSRVVPEMITSSKPGDLFIVRNIGNFVAPFDPDNNYHATASAIEYAVSILEVSDVIVCGHTHCGAIEALYKNIKETPENTHTIKWLELGDEAKKVATLAYKNDEKAKMLRYTEQISVVYQLDNLLTYPAIKRRVEDGSLHLHGWHYDIENGKIAYYDDENYEFKSLDEK